MRGTVCISATRGILGSTPSPENRRGPSVGNPDKKNTFDVVLPQSGTVLVLESRYNVVMFGLKIGFSKVDGASSFSRLD